METLNEFWGLVVTVWNTGFLGLSVGEGVLALIVLLIAFYFRGAIARLIANTLGKLAEKTETTVDDQIVAGIRGPLSLAPVAVGVFIASTIVGLGPDLQAVANRFTQSLITITIFWALVTLVDPLSHLLDPIRNRFSITLAEWVRKGLKVAFWGIAAIGVLQVWGIPVVPVLASLSLLSVAVALGAQDLFKNLISGALIIAERRFQPGDWIRVDGVVEGTVEEVSFRSTKVRRFDKAPVHVPNSKLSDSAVTNFSKMTYRRIYWVIGVEYRTSAEQLRQVCEGIRKYLTEGESGAEFIGPPDAAQFVRVDSFGASSIDIMLYAFTRTIVWGEWLEIKERLAYAVKDIVEGAGTGFAFPSTSLYVETLPGETPEVFSPPKAAALPKPAAKAPAKTTAAKTTAEKAPATRKRTPKPKAPAADKVEAAVGSVGSADADGEGEGR